MKEGKRRTPKGWEVGRGECSHRSRERVYRINTRDAMKQGDTRDIAAAGVREREKGRQEDVTARDRGATVDGNLFSSADGFVLFRVVTMLV